MVERSDPGTQRRRFSRLTPARVFGNAALLAFASLLVISLASGHIAGGLLWAGALLVFLASAFDRQPMAIRTPSIDRVDTLRWCGLALTLAGAALMF
jgi:hypothetical protein